MNKIFQVANSLNQELEALAKGKKELIESSRTDLLNLIDHLRNQVLAYKMKSVTEESKPFSDTQLLQIKHLIEDVLEEKLPSIVADYLPYFTPNAPEKTEFEPSLTEAVHPIVTYKEEIKTEPEMPVQQEPVVKQEFEPQQPQQPVYVEEKTIINDLQKEEQATPIPVIETKVINQPPEPQQQIQPVTNDINRGKSLNEKLAEQKAKMSMSDKVLKQKVDDLKKVIGINERFLFINELFGGNFQAYKKCIDDLNGFKTFDEAIHYIEKEIEPVYNWAIENPTVVSFLTLVERKLK